MLTQIILIYMNYSGQIIDNPLFPFFLKFDHGLKMSRFPLAIFMDEISIFILLIQYGTDETDDDGCPTQLE